MSSQANQIHEHFADWHSRASFEVTADQLKARWKATQTIVDKVATTVEQRLELVRMAHQQDVDPEIRSSIAETLQSADPLFPMESNKLLLGIMACAALIDRFEGRSGHAVTAAAIGVMTASELGWKPSLAELTSSASLYLQKEGQRLRPTKAPAVSDYAAPVKKAVAPMTTQTAAGAVPAPELGAALDAIVTGMAASQGAAARTVEVVSSLREQLNVLWWLFGEHAYCVDQDFSATDAAAAPMILAVDLAALTEFIPAPPAARAFLSKALRLASADGTELSAADAINAIPREVREKIHFPGNERVRTFTPLTELVRRSLETQNKTEWVNPGASATGYPAKKKVAPIHLADGLYAEQLLVRLSG
jgi:hypothetical protein